MKKLIRGIILLLAVMVSACSATGLSIYSLTNTELESALNKKLPSFNKEVRILGIPVEFNVNDLDITIGPQQREIVVLAFSSSAILSTFGINYPIKLKMKIEGNPYYDSTVKAIFLKDLALLESSVDAAGFSGSLGTVNQQIMNGINHFLANNPVYRLNQNNPTEALLSALPIDMRIEEGAITLVPRI